MVFHSEYAQVETVDLPIHEAVLGGAAARGDAPALIDGVEGTTVSYAQLDTFHRRIAAALAEAGLRKGDVLALHSPNTVAFPAVFYAATRAGAAVTTVHPLCTAEEFAKQLADSGARWIVTVSPLLATARAAAELVPRQATSAPSRRPARTLAAPAESPSTSSTRASVRHAESTHRTPLLDGQTLPAGALAHGVREIFVCDQAEGHRSVLDMLGSTAPDPNVAIDPVADLAALPYSSGTTGTPKGVMLTHRSIATNLAQLEPLMPMGPDDRILAVLPFFHIYGLTALMNAPLRQGAATVVLPRFALDTFLAAIEKHRITGLYVAPPIVLALAKHPMVARYDLSSLRYVISAAAPLDAGLAQACARRLNLPPVGQAYGMTELSPGTHVVPLAAADPPPGAVGKLIPSTEMRILSLDDPAQDAAPGEHGEIAIRGPQVMKGYLGRKDATDAMIDEEGWLHTGDVGHVDEDGWLFVVDRVKELIKYKGFQVAPAELEAQLLTHPGIKDAAVIGMMDENHNEVPKAYVVAEALTETDVIAYVAARVAPYKKIRQVEFIASVPRATSGKILRRDLRDRP